MKKEKTFMVTKFFVLLKKIYNKITKKKRKQWIDYKWWWKLRNRINKKTRINSFMNCWKFKKNLKQIMIKKINEKWMRMIIMKFNQKIMISMLSCDEFFSKRKKIHFNNFIIKSVYFFRKKYRRLRFFLSIVMISKSIIIFYCITNEKISIVFFFHSIIKSMYNIIVKRFIFYFLGKRFTRFGWNWKRKKLASNSSWKLWNSPIITSIKNYFLNRYSL